MVKWIASITRPLEHFGTKLLLNGLFSEHCSKDYIAQLIFLKCTQIAIFSYWLNWKKFRATPTKGDCSSF